MKNQIISDVVALRKGGQAEEALKLLETALQVSPEDADLNYQMAWTCDSLGNESAAVPFYEKAIANGLREDRAGAMLGLGSTYRCLGEYEKSVALFNRALEEFPEDRALKVFRALSLYNAKQHDKSVRDLLLLLLDTTGDAKIKSYDRALRFYSDKLDETWK